MSIQYKLVTYLQFDNLFHLSHSSSGITCAETNCKYCLHFTSMQQSFLKYTHGNDKISSIINSSTPLIPKKVVKNAGISLMSNQVQSARTISLIQVRHYRRTISFTILISHRTAVYPTALKYLNRRINYSRSHLNEEIASSGGIIKRTSHVTLIQVLNFHANTITTTCS